MRFASYYFLIVLFILPFWVKQYMERWRKRKVAVRFSSIGKFKSMGKTAEVRFAHLPFILRMIAVVLIVAGLARPQSGQGFTEIKSRGIDIMLVLDTSTSMDIMDLSPTRLGAAKKAMMRFISNRRNDRIGLIIFAGTSFTRTPLTLDYEVLNSFIKPIKSGLVEDGTAIGMAIANGINRLRESKAKSKIIILLTDGVNNRGLIDPETATDLAVSEKIKVYTIGVGRPGVFYREIDDPRFGKRRVPVKSEIDEALLKRIAGRTGARYFKARNEKELEGIYDEIDRLEKSEIKSRIFYEYTEWFGAPVMLALFLLTAEWLLNSRFLRKLPE